MELLLDQPDRDAMATYQSSAHSDTYHRIVEELGIDPEVIGSREHWSLRAANERVAARPRRAARKPASRP